ncbi:hypothetical protein HMPREF9141_2363 [Prevotella multiformis DSM 16608]|uniref:Uncharacterized protein n=1 Tax=Prevotella multiformis DSM 16608 TaxID=888743 RepID=F0F9U6_9BACT|nr:hypothetical protein HMPREF9141_2363 [Prevotella multiformis DSM 16608]
MLFVLLQRKNQSYSLNKDIVKTVNRLFCYHPPIQKPFRFHTLKRQIRF